MGLCARGQLEATAVARPGLASRFRQPLHATWPLRPLAAVAAQLVEKHLLFGKSFLACHLVLLACALIPCRAF
jgi:hypothetical protein